MFDFGYSEIFLVAVVLLIFVGPKELPLLLRSIFDFVSKIKVYSSELRTGIQSIANDIEIEKVSKKSKNAEKTILPDDPEDKVSSQVDKENKELKKEK
jgi:sec-independent protein translocase protein TatB